MKENELMIGDWVKLDFYDNAYADKEDAVWKNGKVTAIHHGNWVDVNFGDPLDECDILVCDIQPIPLTAEILEKNGFENDFYEEESVADYHTIKLEGYSLKHNIGEIEGYLVTWCNGGVNVTTDLNGCVQKDISYVHELQHALRLCGIEKEIEL